MTTGDAPATPALVGREAELAELAAVLTGRSPSRLALVAGEAGIGKSRLVAEAIAATGIPAIVGYATPGTLGRAFAVITAAVEPRVRRWTSVPPALADRHDAVAELLTAVAPALRPETPCCTGPEELVRTAAELIAVLADDHRLVVVLEDLHWADVESLEVFDRLALVEGPVALVGTYRPDELTDRHPAAEMLTRVERRGRVTQIDLGPLDTEDVRRLVDELSGLDLAPRAADALTHRTGGNPFFLEALVRSGAASGPDGPAGVELPRTLADVLRARLDGLDDDTRRVAQVASVMPTGLEFDLLAAVTGLDEPALIDALRTLVQRDVLVETDIDQFAWRHDLVRETVAAGMLGRERRRLHEQAHDVLVADGSQDWATIAVHADGAGRFDAVVAAAERGVGEYLARGASHQALQLAELGLAARPDHALLLDGAARSAWLVGLLDDALAHALHLRRIGRDRDDGPTRAAGLRMALRLAWELGRPAEGREWADELTTLAQQLSDQADQAVTLAAVAQHHMLHGRIDEAERWSTRAVALADASGSRPAWIAAVVEHGSILMLAGDHDAAEKLLEQVAEAAEAEGDHVSATRALHNLVTSPGLVGTSRRRSVIERMRHHATAAGFDSFVTDLYRMKLAEFALDEGDLLEAHAQLERVRGHHRLPHDYASLFVHVLLELDDPDGAARAAARVGPEATMPDLERAWLAARRGDGEGAAEALRDLLADEPPGTATAVAALALAWTDLRDAGVDAAVLGEVAATIADPRRGQRTARAVAGPAEAIAGWAALLDGRDADARVVLDQVATATAAAQATPPVIRAEAHLSLARLDARTRPEAARSHARAALELLDRWPGRRHDAARDLLGSLGSSDAPSAGPSPPALTRREREVAGLLVDGLTNGQIGEQLFISTKTASVHVSNILAKLGLSTRAEIAAWAVRQGMDGD